MLLKSILVILAILGASESFDVLKNVHKDLSAFPLKSSDHAVNTLLRRRRDISASSEEITVASEEELKNILRFFMALAWEEDKKEVLSGFLEEMSDSETNLTVVAWQRILDDHGKVQEIRTVQLVIPPKPVEEIDTARTFDDDDSDEDDDVDRLLPHKELNEVKEMFEPMAQMGIPASITMEKYEEDGEEEFLIYMDKDELYGRSEGFAIYNKTSIATEKEVSDFIDSLKPAGLGKPSVVKYDVDGHFMADHSNIRPHMLGDLMDNYEATDKMIMEAPQIISEMSVQHDKESIPKHLAMYYNKHYPEYKWRVLTNSNNYYVTRDVSLTVTYDNFDLDENSDVEFYIYGVKKSK